MTTATHKLPSILPHDAEAEALIIGIILAGATTWPCIPLAQVRRQLRGSDFYNPVLQDVYEAMLSVDSATDPATPTKVIERMLIDGTISKLRHFFRDSDPQDHPGLRYLEELALVGAVGGALGMGAVGGARARVDRLSMAVDRVKDKSEERDRLTEGAEKAEAYQRNRERFVRQNAPRFLASLLGGLFHSINAQPRPFHLVDSMREMVKASSKIAGEQFDHLEGDPLTDLPFDGAAPPAGEA